jgi:hypothetical protein
VNKRSGIFRVKVGDVMMKAGVGVRPLLALRMEEVIRQKKKQTVYRSSASKQPGCESCNPDCIISIFFFVAMDTGLSDSPKQSTTELHL